MKKIDPDILDFVYYMIHSKSLTREQQARRDKLFARDNMLEKKPDTKNGHIVLKQGSQHSKKTKIQYISPKNLHQLLYRFNQDSILKYTCHEIDTDETIKGICELCGTKTYSVRKHSELISSAFVCLTKSLKDDNIYLDQKMYALISVYLTGKTKDVQTDWSSLSIKTNWANEKLFKWGENNPGMIPSPGRNIARKQMNKGYELPQAYISNLNGNRILTLRELVIYFKSLFHIRRDNSLRNILTYVNEQKGYKNNNINITFSNTAFRDNIELFTDVDKLIQAYHKIIMICKECHEEKKEEIVNIELSFFEENRGIYFCIHDKNSVYNKGLTFAKERIGEQQIDLIINQINGLCDLYIEADFDNKEYARIALWHEGSKSPELDPNIEVERIDYCQGVKYILKF